MGVLRCDRVGCQNIMCDRYSPDHGYICNDCFEELVCLGPEANVTNFMDNPSSYHPDIKRRAAEARFNVEFPSRG